MVKKEIILERSQKCNEYLKQLENIYIKRGEKNEKTLSIPRK